MGDNDKYLEFLMAIKDDVGTLKGQVEQMNGRLGGVEESLQDVRAFQETYAIDNTRDHERTAQQLTNLKQDVNDLKKDVGDLKKRGGGPSLKVVDEVLSFAARWWKPTVAVAVFIGSVVAAWFR